MTLITISKKLIKDDLVIIPRKEYERLTQVLRILPKEQLWFWTKEWQKKEREANEDIRKGRIFGPFISGKDLLKSLNSKR